MVADHDLLQWWIDPRTKYPILDRIGKHRWIMRHQDHTYWFATEAEGINHAKSRKWPKNLLPLSLTFIPATVNDNKVLLRNDPGYLARLSQKPDAERERDLEGRWFFQAAGKLFKEQWFQLFGHAPASPDVILMTCDTADGLKEANDYTVFQIWYRSEGKIYLIHQTRGRYTAETQGRIFAQLVWKYKVQHVSIEAASSGFHLLQTIAPRLGVIIHEFKRSKDKYYRARAEQEWFEKGYVHINPAEDYYNDFITEHLEFAPENKNKNSIHDDIVDCSIDAAHLLLTQKIGYNPLETQLDAQYIS